MRNFYDKEEYDQNDIDSLINNEVEESIYLEYKGAGALDKSDNKKRAEIAKDVSAFANSDGGIIVYGIKEIAHKASELSFIDGDEFTKEWLEQIINSNIQRRIHGLKIFPIRYDLDIKKTIYIIKIPMSLDAPHMSKGNKFYKKYNFESVPMEEYEVRQTYGRKMKSELVISGFRISKIETDSLKAQDFTSFMIEVSVANHGSIVEPTYKVNLYLIDYNSLLDFYWNRELINYDYTKMDNNKIKISVLSTTPIYPNEILNSMRVMFDVPKDKMYEVLENTKIEVRLYYSNSDSDNDSPFQTDFSQYISALKEFETQLSLSDN